MQKVFLMLLCTCWIGWASAQQNQRADSSISQKRQQTDSPILLALPADAPTVIKLKNRLVELALQTPDMRQYTIRKEINKYEANKATAEWLNHFNVNGNVNEFTLKSQKTTTNNFYPRYNFGVSVPLGNLVAIPNEIKRVKANSRLLDVQKESDAMTIRSKVLKAYEDYATNKQLVELQQPLLEDALNHYKRVEEKFSAGEKDVTVEAFNDAYRLYNAEMVKKVTLERDVRQAKIDLEGMIGGITLEEVLRQLK